MREQQSGAGCRIDGADLVRIEPCPCGQGEKREREKRIESLEMEIVAWETRQKTVAAELENPASYEAGGKAMELNRELSSIAAELERLNGEWEKATEEALAAGEA